MQWAPTGGEPQLPSRSATELKTCSVRSRTGLPQATLAIGWPEATSAGVSGMADHSSGVGVGEGVGVVVSGDVGVDDAVGGVVGEGGGVDVGEAVAGGAGVVVVLGVGAGDGVDVGEIEAVGVGVDADVGGAGPGSGATTM